MPRKELFYYVTWGSNVTHDVHWCVTVFYQPIENDNRANQIHGFTIDYGKFILMLDVGRTWEEFVNHKPQASGLQILRVFYQPPKRFISL